MISNHALVSTCLLLAESEGWVVGIGGIAIALATAVVAFLKGKGEVDSKKRRDTLDEVYELVEQLRKDRETDRTTIHDLRDKLHSQSIELAVCKTEHAEAKRRDAEKGRQIAVMAEALRKAGIACNLTEGGGSCE